MKRVIRLGEEGGRGCEEGNKNGENLVIKRRESKKLSGKDVEKKKKQREQE